MAGLKSWRELWASPPPESPLGDGEQSDQRTSSANPQIQEIGDSLRVDLRTEESANRPQIPPVGQRCVVLGCMCWPIDIFYCAEHRRMADDGTLWLRCIFDDGHAPVAANDPIACAEHRARLDSDELGVEK